MIISMQLIRQADEKPPCKNTNIFLAPNSVSKKNTQFSFGIFSLLTRANEFLMGLRYANESLNKM